MQGEHPVQLKENKMLTSAMFLHFGAFHKSTLLLTPAALGHSGCPSPGEGSRPSAHNRRLCWGIFGDVCPGGPKGSP